eukprot:scaffold3150_cov129-Isochrysis_galbana.AAC.1
MPRSSVTCRPVGRSAGWPGVGTDASWRKRRHGWVGACIRAYLNVFGFDAGGGHMHPTDKAREAL